jgi:hypothetical protein
VYSEETPHEMYGAMRATKDKTNGRERVR